MITIKSATDTTTRTQTARIYDGTARNLTIGHLRAFQQATDRLRAATEGKSIREKVTIPVNTARLLLAAADEVALMVDDEDRIMDWMSSGASARIARVVAYGQKIMDERFADGVFE